MLSESKQHDSKIAPAGGWTDAVRSKRFSDTALKAVSASAFGSICAYVQEYGTPLQKIKCQAVVQKLLNMQTIKKGLPVQQPDWSILRQNLYSLAGDWLWRHAANHWRVQAASEIPHILQEYALRIIPTKKKTTAEILASNSRLFSRKPLGKREKDTGGTVPVDYHSDVHQNSKSYASFHDFDFRRADLCMNEAEILNATGEKEKKKTDLSK
eukprot:CAMPEP_0198286254 /NCGR_PEP_ID=MMETSP1449-20131203/5381_1 /TAXON_ID=420275 /ORGANISM="Attheya septentrionalis, Strain CCMP2084" /LENGTH=211 /DNA_ID=CAMNT_0043983941 /DNA_START=178 /DNA_END=813 /DNA_ORIENTATION=-